MLGDRMTNKTTKEAILNTACLLFREKGFDSTTLDEVCAACGITKPTFYKYLPSKETILTSFYDQVCQYILLNFADIYQMESYYDQFHHLYDMVIDSSLEIGPDLIGKMISLNLREDKNSFSAREQVTEIVILLIQRGQKNGEFRSEVDAKNLYDSINFIFLGLELKWCLKKGAIDWKADFRRLSDSLLQTAV